MHHYLDEETDSRENENSIYLLNKLVFTSNILKLSILWPTDMICSAKYVFICPFHTYLIAENFEPDFLGFTENGHRTL